MGGIARKVRLAAIVALAACGASFAACSIDESGLLGNDASGDITVSEGGGGDGGMDVITYDVGPLNCEEAGVALDASCLGNAVPDGWVPVGYQENTNGCGTSSSDFQLFSFVTDAQVPTGGCVCSDCLLGGTWACNATLWTGPTCPGVTDNSTTSTCWNEMGQHFGGSIALSGSCLPTQLLDASVSSTGVSVCVPKTCAANYCGLLGQGFQGCVWNPSDLDAGCPQNFSNAKPVGASANAQCTCPTCGNTNTAGCTGTITAFPNTGCTGIAVNSAAMDGGCLVTTGYSSLYYEAGPVPTPNCQPQTAATGTTSLNGPTTICCP